MEKVDFAEKSAGYDIMHIHQRARTHQLCKIRYRRLTLIYTTAGRLATDLPCLPYCQLVRGCNLAISSIFGWPHFSEFSLETV